MRIPVPPDAAAVADHNLAEVDTRPGDGRETFDLAEEGERFLRAISDRLPKTFIFRIVHEPDGQHRFTYVGSGLKEVTGLTADELYSRSSALTDLIVEEDRERFWTAADQALRSLGTLDQVIRMRRTCGAVRWCHFRSSVRPLSDGTAVCEGILLDVTEHKASEEALRESEARNKALLSALPDMIFVMNREGVYLDYHAAHPELLLVPPEQFLGRKLVDVLPCELGQKFSNIVQQVTASRDPIVLDYAIDIGGELRYFEARVVQCGSDKILSIVRDITDSKRAQDEVLNNRVELARVSRMTMLGEIAASLAHELNQPLSAMLNNTQAGRHLIATGRADLAELDEMLADVAEDCQRAGLVIKRLRSLLDRKDTCRQPIDLNHVVQEVEHLLRSELITRQVRLSTDLAADLPEVNADRVQLQQVVLNLVLNAIDAMGDQPPGDRHVAISTARDRDQVRVALADRGTGIRPQDMDRLFEAFFSTKPTGLGMGLRICSSIVRAHGGNIWAANNDQGSGATFYFTLPAAAGHA